MQTFNRSKCGKGRAGNKGCDIVCREWGLHIGEFNRKLGKVV